MKKQYKNLIMVQTVIISLILVSYIFLRSSIVEKVPKCIIKEKFNILCPACSGTSFAIEMANFRFIKAFFIHPIFFILVVYLITMDIIYFFNVLFNKNIKIFRWWHVLIWGILLIIYTILRNILN